MRAFHRLIRVSTRCAAGLLIIWSCAVVLAGADCAVPGAGNDISASVELHPAAEPDLVLRKWIDSLAAAESGNRDWIAHQDLDGRYNYGCLQFRERTFRFFIKKYKLAANAEPDKIMELIYDCAFQKRLALRMIQEDPENWKHWKKSARRIGLPPGSSDCGSETAQESGNAIK
jgi:hypothetical protein